MKIIRANKNDIPVIRELAEKSWKENYAEILSPEQISYMLGLMYSENALAKDFKNPNYQYYLISNAENNLIGFMGIEMEFEPSVIKLHRIYLLKQEKRKGAGKETLDFLKTLAKQSSATRIILNVNRNNPAKKFYESQGFRVYKEGVFDIGNGFLMDDYLMEFQL